MYRAALLATLILAVIAAFTLGRPGTPSLSGEPVSFDGDRAASDMRDIVAQFPQRVTGSDVDDRAGIWFFDQFEQMGLKAHTQGFTASIGGEDVALRNVWAVDPGETDGTILLLANRDISPLTSQGANDNASGAAALLEMARAFTATAHSHTLVFLVTTGDAFGAVGARAFLREYEARDDVWAVITMRELATRERRGLAVNGWSPSAKTAPPWLWLLAGPAGRAHANTKAILPGVAAQVINLAAPTDSGSQGPFVADGIPAVTISAVGERVSPQNDTLDAVSADTLRRGGSAVQAMVMALDAGQRPALRSGGTIFLTSQRTLPGASLALLLAGCLLPLAVVTVDLFAHCRRARVRLRPALTRAILHLIPWLIVLAIVYLANVVGLLPKTPGAVIPAASPLVDDPPYVRVALLIALLVAVYVLAVRTERRLERGVANDPRAAIFVAHFSLVIIAVVALLVNPYSVLLVVPAALLWPLARPGAWPRALLVPYAGLSMILVVLVYFAWRLDVGWNVWWYFLLLVETRTVPFIVVLLGVLFVSEAAVLAHTLHDRTVGAQQLKWSSGQEGEVAETEMSPRRRGAGRLVRPPGRRKRRPGW